MRIQLNRPKFLAWLVAGCATAAALGVFPANAQAQERAVIEAVAPPTWETFNSLPATLSAGLAPVTSASGVADASRISMDRIPLPVARTARLLQDNPDGQSTAALLPQPPAAKGPSSLPNSTLSPSDNPLKLEPEGNAATNKNLDDNDNSATDSRTKKSEADDKKGTSSDTALTPLQNRDLSIRVQIVDLSVAGLGTGKLPESASAKLTPQTTLERTAVFKCVHWHPSTICHYPLRFEETALERHGHVRFGCWQPLASGARFLATIPMLPYLYTLQSPCEPVYALGSYRPGSCAPLLRDSIPYDSHAAVVEAMSLAGFFWAAPL